MTVIITKEMVERLVNGNEKFAKECPRCGRAMSEYPALSRYANVNICSDCGTEEALNDWIHNGNSFNDWKLGRRSENED